jgi:hypothetical protein
MRPQELTRLIRTHPFVPFRIHLTDGQTFDIFHPDQIIVLRGRVDIGVEPDVSTGVVNRVEHCSLLHVVRVEELPSPSQSESP